MTALTAVLYRANRGSHADLQLRSFRAPTDATLDGRRAAAVQWHGARPETLHCDRSEWTDGELGALTEERSYHFISNLTSSDVISADLISHLSGYVGGGLAQWWRR